MHKVCAWCRKDLSEAIAASKGTALVSHGICEACAETVLCAIRSSARDFLEELDAPVFLLDADGRAGSFVLLTIDEDLAANLVAGA